MSLNLSKSLEYTSKHYILNKQDPINNIEKIDANSPYVLTNGIHAGSLDLSRWKTTIEAYRGVGLNSSGIYGIADEDGTAIPKFLLTAKYVQSYGWGTAVPGEFRVGDNVREEKGFLVGKNWLWYTPVKGLNISGPLLRTISSDTNIIQSPSFDNITEFILNNTNWSPDAGYGGGPCLILDGSGSIIVKGKKTIDGALIIRGSVMYKNSINFPFDASIYVQAEIFDINENSIAISTSAINPNETDDWRRHNYVLRLGPHDNADTFIISLVVKNLPEGSGHTVTFDNWNAYRVFQSGMSASDLIEALPEDGKSVIYDILGIRAYREDNSGNPQLTFKLNAATGDAFFAGNMEVRGYIHSGPTYLYCDPDDEYNPTYHHEIVGCGINTYAIYGVAPNNINAGQYNIGRSKFILSVADVLLNRDCDKWYWGEKLFAGELRVGTGLFYSYDEHNLFNLLTPNDIHQKIDSPHYLWFYPGDKSLDSSNPRYYPFLKLKGNMLVDGYVHSGPIYDEDLANKNNPPVIGGCGINQFAIYGIKTMGSGTSLDPYKPGESRFLLANQSFSFSGFDPYWGDQIFEGELRVGINILYDENEDKLVDSLGNPSISYMWFRPVPQGSSLQSKFEVKAAIIAGEGSIIPPEAIEGVDSTEDILNNHQRWEVINLTELSDFLSHSQGNPLTNGLVAHSDYFGYYYYNSEPSDLYSWKFKVDKNGYTFFGNYGEGTEERNFVFWDGSDLRIEGGLFAYKGFFRDLLYVGNENTGIEIYGGDDTLINQSSFFVEDPITKDFINTPYIRSVDIDNGFSKGGWIILNDGTASYSKINGIGTNIHITTDHYWNKTIGPDGEDIWSKKENYSYSGFLTSYEGIEGTLDYPACAIYLHDPPANIGKSDISNYTLGCGCFSWEDGTYSILFYDSATTSTLNNVKIDTARLSAIILKTEDSSFTQGSKGLYLQTKPTEPIGFFGSSPKARPHITLKDWKWDDGSTDSRLEYLKDIIIQLTEKLGEYVDPDDTTEITGLGLFSWEHQTTIP